MNGILYQKITERSKKKSTWHMDEGDNQGDNAFLIALLFNGKSQTYVSLR